MAGLASGVASGAGSYVGGQLLGPELGGIGSGVNPASGGTTSGFLGTPLSQSLSQFGTQGASDALNPAASIASSVFGQATPGSIIGGAIGSGIAGSATQSALPNLFTSPTQSPPGWSPSEQSASTLPGSLSSYSSLNPNQQASNLATRGVYGGGNGPDETNYFLNLANRSLFDQGGNVAANTNNLAPIDMSYLNQLGISGTTPTDILQGISRYGT